MDDLREEFIAETRETLEILANQLVQWEKSPGDRDLIDSAFRFVHTVKGSCGFLDLPRLARLSHAAEEVLSAARDGRIVSGRGLVSATLTVIDRIAALTEALVSGEPVQDDDADLIAAMLAFLPGSDAASAPTLHMPPSPGPAVENALQAKPAQRTVRVSLTMLDSLMNGVSDLVLARNEVSRQMRGSAGSAQLEAAFGRLSSSVAELRDAIGQMRMQPIDRLFSSLPRLMRDISVDLGKQIELFVEGNDVEIDREMVESLRDPLTHILRNAADHGIENVPDRVAAGKDPTGHVRVSARQSGSQILIEIVDDGRGISLDKLGQKAIARGILSAAVWAQLSERAKLDLVFAPGLSTADEVTAISGRGVGMDVVRANMRAVGGTIDLENNPGSGLRITLRLPMTLSIIAGVTLRAGGEAFAVSRSSVLEIISAAGQHVTLENIGGVTIANVRGQRLAYARLADIFGLAASRNEAAGTLLIIKPAVGAVYAIEVDAVLDHEELVIKPGSPLAMASGLYAGTTLPDNGRPMLLLDASGVAAAIGADKEMFVGTPGPAEDEQADGPSHKVPVLLFVSHEGCKQAVRLAAVERVDEIAAQAISRVGARLCAKADGELRDLLGLDAVPACGTIPVVHMTDGQQSKLLAVREVLDIIEVRGAIAPAGDSARFEGIIDIGGELIELLSVYALFENPAGSATSPRSPALCFIEADKENCFWETQILAPLLEAAGYEVSTDPSDRNRADVHLTGERDDLPVSDSGAVLRLRERLQPEGRAADSIYRYDRVALLSAISAKIAGGR